MPICFGISFTKTALNQASAMVNIYLDGSVGISTGAVEMGQGVNTRIAQVPISIFGIAPHRVKIETTNTTRIINTSPSAASSTADLNGKATSMACAKLLKRLQEFALELLKGEDEAVPDDSSLVEIIDEVVHVDGQPTALTWEELIQQAYMNRINLSEKAFYATPTIYFDQQKEKGHPFAYHVYGSALTVVTVDIFRGTYTIDEVSVVHDVGKSMNRTIDMGQLEGGLVQGIGWMTMEELRFDTNGKLLSNALSTYKVPDIYSVPNTINVTFLETEEPFGLMKSKAIGEPPLMYGIGTYFALLNAVENFNPNAKLVYDTPMTPEKLLTMLWNK